jgi:hypothetical protein
LAATNTILYIKDKKMLSWFTQHMLQFCRRIGSADMLLLDHTPHGTSSTSDGMGCTNLPLVMAQH